MTTTMQRRESIGFVGIMLALMPGLAEAQRSYPVDFQLMPLTQSVRRHQSVPPADPTSATGTLKGVEMSVLGQSGIGLFGRYLSGNLSGPSKPTVAEGGLIMGDKTFRIEVGYSDRLFIPDDSTIAFARGGFNLTTFLGTSGVAVRFRAGYYAAIERFRGMTAAPDGWQGESSVSYTWDRVPVFAELGYRIDRLRTERTDEEWSALTLGVGIWFWSR